MKVISVYGDDDYGVISFDQSELGSKSLQEVWAFVMSEHNGKYCYDDGENQFYIDCYDFEGVTLTQDFLDFINEQKDYDSTKHKDWFVVDELK